jgi:Mrp family chromosome partitioning ATPase
MSERDNTFIDAYGLELTDKLEATYAAPTRREPAAVHEPVTPSDAERQERAYRFDAAARRRTLRGPHFDMRRVASRASEQSSGWDAFDANVIDVGAAWASSPTLVQPSIEMVTEDAAESSAEELADVAEIEDTIEVKEVVADVLAPVVKQPKATVSNANEAKAPEPLVTAKQETPAAPTPPPTIESPERLSPVWEVDRFLWPDEIEQLFKTQTEYFDYAGKKLVAASREGLKILAITSAQRGEGSTTLALCLARAAAGAGAKVGLLDGNLTRSELGEKLGVEFGSGWQSAAVCEQPLAEAAITGLEEKITLFPSAAGPGSEITSLGDDRVGQVFRAAAASFDLLIIDAGTADLGKNVEAVDAAIVARDVRHTSEEETLTVATALRNSGVKAVGIAENFSSSQANRAAA